MHRIPFSPGDVVSIDMFYSKVGKGLSYKAQELRVADRGVSGGWDVYEGVSKEGMIVSFHGFSVQTVERRT